jgi:hypothetical protein
VTRPSSAPTRTSAPHPELPAHRNAVAGKAWIRDTIDELTGQLGADNPAELADHLTLALEGLLATGQALGPDGPASARLSAWPSQGPFRSDRNPLRPASVKGEREHIIRSVRS